MVDAEKSGVMFTSHPSTGESKIIIEAAWGLGEAVVSGSVSPDNYVIDRETAEIAQSTVTDKRIMMERDPDTGRTIQRDVPNGKRTAQVLDGEIETLVELGKGVETHYGTPQDVEWAIADGEVYMLQSRPITTIDDDAVLSESVSDESGETLTTGLGASPGIVSGTTRIVRDSNQFDEVRDGDIIVTEMTTHDMVPATKRAEGIVTDEGA